MLKHYPVAGSPLLPPSGRSPDAVDFPRTSRSFSSPRRSFCGPGTGHVARPHAHHGHRWRSRGHELSLLAQGGANARGVALVGPENPRGMDSRVEVTRAWDLFHLGAFAEVESLLSTIPKDPEAERLRLWIAIRRGDNESKRRFGAWLAENGDEKLAAVGRAHENVALAAFNLPRKEWLPPTSKWAAGRSRVRARAYRLHRGRAQATSARQLAQALPQIPEQRVRYAQLRAWIYGLDEQFEKQATHLLHALSLALERERGPRSHLQLLPNRSRLSCAKSSSVSSGCARKSCSNTLRGRMRRRLRAFTLSARSHGERRCAATGFPRCNS